MSVNIDSINGLSPFGAKPFTESMLTLVCILCNVYTGAESPPECAKNKNSALFWSIRLCSWHILLCSCHILLCSGVKFYSALIFETSQNLEPNAAEQKIRLISGSPPAHIRLTFGSVLVTFCCCRGTFVSYSCLIWSPLVAEFDKNMTRIWQESAPNVPRYDPNEPRTCAECYKNMPRIWQEYAKNNLLTSLHDSARCRQRPAFRQ